jgi:hypothetical protein
VVGSDARAAGLGGALRIQAARFFIDVGASRLAERALAQEIVAAGKSVDVRRWARGVRGGGADGARCWC